MDKPKISVIVPIYKVEKYLVQCIDSIVNQTLKDIEIILVDEGDMDACRFIIDHYEQTDCRVKAIHEKNGGYGASVNKGFDIATGEYISIIESDDFIEPTMYEEMYEYAKKLDADVVKTPYYEYFDKTKDNAERNENCFWKAWVKDIPENRLFKIQEYPVLFGIHPSMWSAIYKTDYFLNHLKFRFPEVKGAGYVDHYFKIQVLMNTDKLAYLDKPYYHYRLSNAEASSATYDIGAMIQRWNEAHKLLETYKEQNLMTTDLNIWNLREEYVNTFEKLMCFGYKITPQQKELLEENLQYITTEEIKQIPYISDENKRIFAGIKKNPKKLQQYVSNNVKHENEKINFLFKIIPFLKIKPTKLNTYQIYLFNIPFAKIKQRNPKRKEYYLFNLLPIFRVEEK